MVKNTHGGSGHKKFARKFNNSSSKSNKLRISENAGEIYAIATKMLGNNMFHCHGIDNTVKIAHIRGKFTGRGKRDNMVEIGKWVLIGLREWDIPSESSSNITTGKTKLQQCDLLEVYTDLDKQRLRETINENWNILDMHDISKTLLGTDKIDDDIVFGTERDFERDRIIQEMNTSTERISLKLEETNEEEQINFDDI
jgi:translation initiation factor IF-1